MNYRFLISLLVGIGLIVVVLILIFRGGSSPAPGSNPAANLLSFANTSTTVQLTDSFPVSADQTHHAFMTVVGKDQTTFTVEQGYQGQVLRSQTYQNNSSAYAVFLRALQIAGYNRGNNDPKLADERGYCPLGHVYTYEVKDGNNTLMRYWATSCGGLGNSRGRTDLILQLFQRQVPDYNKLTQNITL
jgi:hypothetical protein